MQGVRQHGGKGLYPQVWKWLWPPDLLPGFWAPLLRSLGLDMNPGLAGGNEDQLMTVLGQSLQGVLRDWRQPGPGSQRQVRLGNGSSDGGSAWAWYDKAYISVSSLKVKCSDLGEKGGFLVAQLVKSELPVMGSM